MRWQGGNRYSGVEDRRGMGPVGAVGGLGAGGVILALMSSFLLSIAFWMRLMFTSAKSVPKMLRKPRLGTPSQKL